MAKSRTVGKKGADFWHLRLYIVDQTPRSLVALANLKKICEEHLAGRHNIEVVDVRLHPEKSDEDRIFAVPTVVRKLPPPIRHVIGDLSRTEEVLVGLEVVPKAV